jgi:tRNA (guanine-N7-)-methyltransferase
VIQSGAPEAPGRLRSGLHGRRKGKALRPRQAALVEELLPLLSIDIAAKAPDVRTLFPQLVSDVWLEIGFGGGEHLVKMAAEHPNVGLIGCEPFVNGMAKALVSIQAHRLANIRLRAGDAADLIAWLPAACLDRVFLLFPDPWPKRRQHKRRFVSDERLATLARVMRSGAELHFATDIDDYAGWTLARILRSADFLWPAEQSRDWRLPWPGWHDTRYGAKAKQAGRRPVYLTFTRR